ncbi:MAG: tetratricopeptide repeat protein, partial [Bryobacteraceae bacterium]
MGKRAGIKNTRGRSAQGKAVRPERAWSLTPTFILMMVAVALAVCFELYLPSIRSPFAFDDAALPFEKLNFDDARFLNWVAGLRPMLMASYWVNFQISGRDTLSYHVVNMLIHTANVCLVFLVVRKIAEWAAIAGKRRDLLSAFAAALFLAHPLQTESVAYIAGRSESLSALFLLAAYAVFLYRRNATVSFRIGASVLILYAFAAATKEQTVVLPAVLVLTDFFWGDPRGWRAVWRNWKFYAVFVVAGAIGLIKVWQVLAVAPTAGFHVQGIAWWQYFFTECRAIFTYLRMFVLPYGQTIDHDFPLSHTPWQYGAVFYMIAVAALVWACFHFRKRFPLPCFGGLLFLTLLAPTSSIVPIADPLAERRIYAPMLGLLLILVFLLKDRIGSMNVRWALGAVLLMAAFLCYQRNALWGRPFDLWKEAVDKRPHKDRPYGQMAQVAIFTGRCQDALPYMDKAVALLPDNWRVYMDRAKVQECLGRKEDAVASLKRATAIMPNDLDEELLGLLYGEIGKQQESKA